MTRVDILYFDDCPNVEPAAARVRDVAARLQVEIDLRMVLVQSIDDAMRTRFLGSPTVHVNGVDIDPSASDRTDFGMSCRMYGTSGVPSEAMIVSALRGERRDPGRPATLATVTSMIAAALSSACCWLPLLFVAAGLSVGGLSIAFAVLRPWLIGAAVLSLGFGIWLSERRPRAKPGCECPPVPRRRRLLNRAMLAMSAAGVLAFTFFPQYVNAVFGGLATGPLARTENEVTVSVTGMTCAGCETGIEAAVRRVPGVALVEASYTSYENSVVVIGLNPGATVSRAAIVAAVEQAGYSESATGAQSPSAVDTLDTSVRLLDDDAAPVKEAFNAAASRTRFLAILSPT